MGELSPFEFGTAGRVLFGVGRFAELLRGGLTARVAGTYPFEEAVRAHERLAKGGVRGRLVLVP